MHPVYLHGLGQTPASWESHIIIREQTSIKKYFVTTSLNFISVYILLIKITTNR